MSTPPPGYLPANLALIDRLRKLTDDAMAGLIPDGARFALIDFPNHDNVGDTAIYLGELAYLRRRKLAASYVAAPLKSDFAALAKAIGDGPILLHGGGNFGDVWPWFQPYREQVLDHFKGRPVVQLPQTIHYASQEKLDETARVIARHGAFTLLVRDRTSLEIARRNFDCDVRLCPDMAFQIGPLKAPTPTRELVMLMREDREALEDRGDADLRGDFTVIDWPKEPRLFKWSRYGLMMGATFLSRPLQSLAAHKEMRYRLIAWARFRRGLARLASGRVVITDRLHAHIISTLLGRPHCVLDNSYGKISSFMDAWQTQVPHVHRAASVAEAVDVLRETEALSCTR